MWDDAGQKQTFNLFGRCMKFGFVVVCWHLIKNTGAESKMTNHSIICKTLSPKSEKKRQGRKV